MHHDYRDITERISTPPTWWDENGTPRWGVFEPDMVPDIYADECCLVEIECQACSRLFQVAISRSMMSRLRTKMLCQATGRKVYEGEMMLATSVREKSIHYGDPPNHVDEDHAGSTMNCIDRRVLEFWRKDKGTGYDWARVTDLEIALE